MSKKNTIYLYKYIEVFLWYVDGKIELQHCNTATLLALKKMSFPEKVDSFFAYFLMWLTVNFLNKLTGFPIMKTRIRCVPNNDGASTINWHNLDVFYGLCQNITLLFGAI